jgi:hypothetical protein
MQAQSPGWFVAWLNGHGMVRAPLVKAIDSASLIPIVF